VAIAIGRARGEERLSNVGHLEELRARLIVSVAVLAAAFAVCVWQSPALLEFVNAPLAGEQRAHVGSAAEPAGERAALGAVAGDLGSLLATLRSRGSGLSGPARRTLARTSARLARARSEASSAAPGRPVTLSIGEPFSASVGVALLFAFLLSLPVLVWQLFGFVEPALDDALRRATRRLLFAVPALFAAGVAFGYLVVLPAAIHFLVNFNAGQFDVLVQAGQYYRFAATVLLAMGILFQVPVVVIAAVNGGLVTPAQLRRNRRYAFVACAAVAAFLPGDAVTLALEIVPLYLLFEGSVALAALAARRATRRAAPR